MSRIRKAALVLCITSALLSGCASHKNKDSGEDLAYTEANDGMVFEGIDHWSQAERDYLQQRVYHFAFDSFSVQANDMAAVQAHARYLQEHPNVTVRVEGHTDERGSRDYNIGLGERRAKAVAQVLTSHGAATHQVNVVSYGAEKPVDPSHEESAWAQNRRAVIVYESR